MRGMFAVAIWDAPKQRLILARDRVGKKPLYYYRHNNELLFGSETKAILAALDQAPPIHAPALARLPDVWLRRGPGRDLPGDASARAGHRA